jgi:phosphohistidine phosphatase
MRKIGIYVSDRVEMREKMKTLLLMKHAESGWENKQQGDWFRPLTDYGQMEAFQIGKLLSAENQIPDLILASSAVRAVQTAKMVIHALDCACPLHSLDDLYLAEMEFYIQEIHKSPNRVKTLLVVGHDPNLSRLLKVLTEKEQAIPSDSLAVVSVAINSWNEFRYDVQGDLVEMMKGNLPLPSYQDCEALAELLPAAWRNPDFPAFPGQFYSTRPVRHAHPES